MSELTELTDDPEVIEGNAEANRWTKYGKDRVYLNDNDFSGKYDAYIDLETGEFVCEHSKDFQIEIEDGTATITSNWTAKGEEYSEVVVVVELYETEDECDEAEAESEEGEPAEGGENGDAEDDDTVRIKVGNAWECEDCEFEVAGNSVGSREEAKEHEDENPGHNVEHQERYKEYPAEAICDRCGLELKQAGEDHCPLCVMDLGGAWKPYSTVDPEAFEA